MQRSMRVLARGLALFAAVRRRRRAGLRRDGRAFGRAGRRLDRAATAPSKDFDTPGKIAGHPVGDGSVVVVRSAGGGGYGDPLLREPARVQEDVEEGYVSRHAARDLYGVALDARGVVDSVATEALRRRLRESRFALTAVLVDDSYEAGAVSRRRICRLNPRDAVAAGLQADDLVEIDARQAAPLRAWLRIDPSIEAGTLPIDQVGLTILKVSPGQRLEVRRIATVILPQERLAEAAE